MNGITAVCAVFVTLLIEMPIVELEQRFLIRKKQKSLESNDGRELPITLSNEGARPEIYASISIH